MGVHVTSEVWANSEASGTALLVQLALADHADDRSRECWPSLAHLARKTRVSRDTVRRALRDLEATGEVEVPRRGGGHQSARYVIRRYESATGSNLHPVAEQVPRGSTRATSEVARVQPESSITIKNPSGRPKATDDPVKARAHALTRLAFEQPRRPVLKSKGEPFAAVLGIFAALIEAGVEDDEIAAAVKQGIDVWTTAGVQTAIAKARRSNGAVSYEVEQVTYS